MYNSKQLKDSDWYDVLNQKLQNVDKEIENVAAKGRHFIDKHLKINQMDIIYSKPEFRPKQEERNLTETNLPFPNENKLISYRLNLKNYKDKKIAGITIDYKFMKDILERLDNKRLSIQASSNKSRNNMNNIYEKTFFNYKYNRNKNGIKNKGIKHEVLSNERNGKRISLPIENKNPIVKTFNNTRNYSSSSIAYFPKIKNKKDLKKESILNNNIYKYNFKSKSKPNIKSKSSFKDKQEMMKHVLIEEGKTLYRGKSITGNILRYKKTIHERMNSNNEDNDSKEKSNKEKIKDNEIANDYIVINKKKIYQINPESEINRKFKENIKNIKNMRDIEEKLLNGNKSLFDLMKRNLIKNYKNKKKKILMNKLLEEENL